QSTNPIDQTADDGATADSGEAMPAPTSDTAAEIAESFQTPSMDSPEGTVLGQVENDFANRTGDAKQKALLGTGGSENTEISVKRALDYLVSQQRENGSWDPRTSHAGLERSPLGESRGSAGSHAETALTGLALLSLMGAGHTHQEGQYADAVYKGLAFLIHQQKPNGSMQGNAKIYEATYCHGMAALAMCEAAAITRDASAILSAERAIAHTQALQHPATGGWRYTEGDPGDLSQLGWQAMVLDSGNRAGIAISDRSILGVQRFLQSVQVGRSGGLASYRRGEAPTHTMTAEALATRILIGDKISKEAIEEAEAYLMLNLPGNGQDNYYYWYYATIGLHQLQNENWNQWNQALQQRLLTTQNPDGSWPTQTLWGGYGGKIYTTAMATLCLETYYRHTIRNNRQRIAQQPNQPLRR
ncbi:MAG: prenyltransferase/squalene oxidase repeat-containing protein, partial [Planctomycetota bacterium]|nr:prenyltransferase/squalene oxidase repeat-containing protein [Planctomycetota bacterium]